MPAGREPVSRGLKLGLAVQALFAAVFLLLGWSHTVSLAQGRAASLVDILALSLPLMLVIALGTAAVMLARKGQGAAARLCALLPWPLAVLAGMILGAI